MNATVAHLHSAKVAGGFHCSKDALTDLFGWFLQVLLACLAFTCLIAKRFCEPIATRRSWLIWFYDTSKQGMGAMAIHLANVFLSEQYTGDPCTWYLINFMLDSSVGLLIIFIGIRLCQYLARTKGWEEINFGEYGKPPSANAWLAQCCLYIILMVIVKVSITLFMQLNFWERVKDFILSPIDNPKVELAFVMLIIPFFVNAYLAIYWREGHIEFQARYGVNRHGNHRADTLDMWSSTRMLMFWVTDNFLMHKDPSKRTRRTSTHDSLLHRAKVKYHALRKKARYQGTETDTLLSADDELIDAETTPIAKNIIA